jgi:hypothetical protein
MSKPIAAYFTVAKNCFVIISSKASRYLKLRTGPRHAMKQEEARRLLIEEWDKWIRTQPVTPDGPRGGRSSAGAAHAPGNLPGKSACRQPPRSYKDLDELRPICRDGLGSRSEGPQGAKPENPEGSAGDDIAGRLL